MFQEASREIKSIYLIIALRNIRVRLIVNIDDVNYGEFECFAYFFIFLFAQGG